MLTIGGKNDLSEPGLDLPVKGFDQHIMSQNIPNI